MIVGEEKKPSLEALRHHGTKGMKWGQRKAHPTSGDIHAARGRQAQRADKWVNAQRAASDEFRSETQRKKARVQIAKTATEFNRSEDRVTAARMTKGEKAAAIILAGPLSLVIIGGSAVRAKSIAKSVDKERQGK